MATVLLLQARGGMSAPELARHLEVSVRTIYRDVEALSAAGIPVYVERGPRGGLRLLDGYRTDLTGLSTAEAEALFLLGLPGPLEQLGMRPALDGARRKLLAALPAARRQSAEGARQRVHVDPTGWDQSAGRTPHLLTIAHALFAARKLELDYVRADNQLVRRTVSPQGLVLKGSIWYLVALAGRWDATFRVSRVRSAAVIDEPATQIPDFDLTAYWERSVAEVASERAKGRVTVHLRADRAAADELPWVLGEATRHQVVSAAEEDREALDLEVSFDSIDDACRTLLSLGGSVEVLDPPQLREHLVRGAHALIARYEVAERRPAGATRD